MSDGLEETKNLARYVCPTCEPEADPIREIFVVDYCEFHKPSLAGVDDRLVEAPVGILGNSDTDLETQRGMARLLGAPG